MWKAISLPSTEHDKLALESGKSPDKGQSYLIGSGWEEHAQWPSKGTGGLLKGGDRQTLFFFLFLMKYIWFTYLCSFLLYIKVIQLYTHTHTHTHAHTHTHSFFNILFHYGLPQETGYSSLCYTVGPCCLSVLNVIVWIYQPQAPSPSLSHPFSPLATSLVSMGEHSCGLITTPPFLPLRGSLTFVLPALNGQVPVQTGPFPALGMALYWSMPAVGSCSPW